MQRFNKLFSKPLPTPKKDPSYSGASRNDWSPGPSPDEMNSHNRPLPVLPRVTGSEENGDEDDDDDPADYDEVCTHEIQEVVNITNTIN